MVAERACMPSFSKVKQDTIGWLWTGEFALNTLRVDGDIFEYCHNKFWGRFSSLSLYNLPEGNLLAATELVRLLEVAGTATAKQSNGKTENRPLVGSNVTLEFNATT